MLSRSPVLASLFAAIALNLAAPPVAARQQAQQQPPPRTTYEPTVGMPGKDAVWVPTDPARNFELMFRAYGPTKDFFDRKWVLSDVVKVGE